MLGAFGLQPKGTMVARALPAARELVARGHQVTIVMPPWHTPEEADRAWWDAEGGVRLEYVSLRGLGLPGVGHGLVARRLVHRALREQPDIVHAFKPKAYSGLAAAELRLRQLLGWRRALVVDSDDWEGPGGWNDVEGYGWPMRWLFARQERWGLRHADGLTVASRALETLAWALGVPPRRVSYLPNALDAAAWRWLASGEPAGRREGSSLLLYTRFFEFDVRRPLLVLGLVRAVVPEARLVVVWRGLRGEEEPFLAQAAQMGLGGAVQYRGWLERVDLARQLAEVDVALFPFDDTLINRTKCSVKLLELMAAGLPVVADAVGENAEVIEPGRSGLLVPPGDVTAMARGVIDLLGDPERRRALGSAARQRVGERFRWQCQVERLEEAYRRALAARLGAGSDGGSGEAGGSDGASADGGGGEDRSAVA